MFYAKQNRILRTIGLMGLTWLLSSLFACGKSDRKKVTVANQSTQGANAYAGMTDGSSAGILLVDPRTGQPAQDASKCAMGDSFQLTLQISGYNPNEFSIGYMSEAPVPMQISGNTVSFNNIPKGIHRIKFVARRFADCEALRRANCRPNGQAVQAETSNDLTKDFFITAVDPSVEFSRVKSSGGGLAGIMGRGDGLLGSLLGAFTGGIGGGQGGGILGGSQQQQPGQQVPQQSGF